MSGVESAQRSLGWLQTPWLWCTHIPRCQEHRHEIQKPSEEPHLESEGLQKSWAEKECVVWGDYPWADRGDDLGGEEAWGAGFAAYRGCVLWFSLKQGARWLLGLQISQQLLPECTGSELAMGFATWRVVCWYFRSSWGPRYEPETGNESFSVFIPIW